MEQHIIHIKWKGPYPFKKINKLTKETIDYGLYQVYGTHPVYGSNVLLYIGKADLQTFGVRVSQEPWGLNEDAQSVQIYVGRLAGESTPSSEKWSGEIDLAEKLLIHAHSPALNSHYIEAIPNNVELQNIHILNWGCYRNLMPEVSGARWTSKYDVMPLYQIYGSEAE